MVNAEDLKSSEVIPLVGSSPTSPTIQLCSITILLC